MLKSSQQIDSSSRSITFIKSPVEKDTSQPEISYTDPDTETKEMKYEKSKQKQVK